MSKSQINQDLNVLSFFNKMKELYFVDIGANDGETLSNTYILEKSYQWNGICSEPMPKAFDKLRKCRNVYCDNNAVFSESGLSLKFSLARLLSGLTDYIDCHKEVKNNEQIIVNTITLQDLLNKYNAPNIIHYLSLDTEGSEYEILKSVNFSEYKFLYINLEHNYIEPRRTNIRNLLLNNGYLYKGENKFDDDYIHESTLTGTYYFKNDYSKPILIKRNGNNQFTVSSSYWQDDVGVFKDGIIKFNRLGKGMISYQNLDFGNNNRWQRDCRDDSYF